MSDLRRAAAVYDATPALRDAAATARGFEAGGEWMRLALATLRGEQPSTARPPFARLGWVKYATASAIAIVAICITLTIAWPLAIVVGPLAFYAAEAQAVFLFPVALDGAPRPFAAARRLTVRAGGTAAVVCGVVPIAAHMLLGGLLGRGFVRSWAIGCLAVCVWYERVRTRPREVPKCSRLEIAARRPHAVRREAIHLGLPAPVRVLYASDLHLGRRWTAAVPAQLLAAVAEADPHVVLLGGDLADVPAGLQPLAGLVHRLAVRCPVAAVGGNHDRPRHARRAVTAAGGRWLDWPWHTLGLTIGPTPAPGIDVVCGHDPAVFPAAADAGCRVVLAGHLHGGQCVLHTRPDGRLWPGCWANRWTGLRFRRHACHLLVSRGCGDTLPVRWNCPREVILCEFN